MFLKNLHTFPPCNFISLVPSNGPEEREPFVLVPLNKMQAQAQAVWSVDQRGII